MKIRTKIILAFLILAIPVAIIGTVSILQLNALNKQLDIGTVQNIQNFSKITQLNSLSQFIRYFDEVLTQSARNYAFTGDKKWKDRYDQAAPELDKQIKQAISLGDEEDKKLFDSIDAANLALVDMETKAMNFVDQGKKQEAVKILEGDEYAKQKDIYKEALVTYVQKQGKKYDETLVASTDTLTNNVKAVQGAIMAGVFWTALAIGITILIAIILGIITANLVAKPINLLNKATKEIAAGNLDQKVEIISKDEIGEAAANFNEMVNQLHSARANIEAKIADRTAELEKTNKYMTGREFKMIELKKQIADLQNEIKNLKKNEN